MKQEITHQQNSSRKHGHKKFGFSVIQNGKGSLALQEIGREIPPVPKDLPEPQLSSQSINVLTQRYLVRNEEREVIETPRELFWRVAYNVATAERIWGDEKKHLEVAKEFYKLLANRDFSPNSPTLMNAGRPLQQLSGCFVVPIEDSMESIYRGAVANTAIIHKSGGGTGFNFSQLRPTGDLVLSTKRESTGPVGFIRSLNEATETVKQGGTRRGANMGMLNDTHPDIVRFILSKADPRYLNNFNISVAMTDAVIEKIESDQQFVEPEFNPQELFLKAKETQEALFEARGEKKAERDAYEKTMHEIMEVLKAKDEAEGFNLINPRDESVWGRINSAKLFQLMVYSAWANGDPGLIFIDKVNNDNPTPHLGRIEATNPCGEQPLLAYESCNLGSINLANMVEEGEVNWKKLNEVTKKAVRFLDNVVDMNRYPIPEIEKMTKGNRKIGLGVMGFAEMLIKLGLPYDSEEGLQIAEKVMKAINDNAFMASRELALERGVFPNFKGSIYDNGDKNFRVRNAARTTIAPTGTISMIMGVSSGIEPLYGIAYRKNVVGGVDYDVNALFVEAAKQKGFYSDEVIGKVADKGSVRGLDEVPSEVQKVFGTAHEISPEWHVRMQAAFQKHVNNAVSKTINLGEPATLEDIRDAYLLSYRSGCKGITVYRDGSREEQILYAGKKEEKQTKKEDDSFRPRPHILSGITMKEPTPVGTLYVNITQDEEGYPMEVFVVTGKGRTDTNADAEGIGRVISTFLRFVPREQTWPAIDLMIEQLEGIGGGTDPETLSPHKTRSLPDGISKALKAFKENCRSNQLGLKLNFENKNHQSNNHVSKKTNGGGNFCPACQQFTLIYQEGCQMCRECGYSKC